MNLEELLQIGQKSPIFKFDPLLFPNDIKPQLNFIDSNIVCIGIQASWIPQEVYSFLNHNLELYFLEVDGILEIVYEFGDIFGDVAFNPRNRDSIISVKNIQNTNSFIVVLSLADENGKIIANRGTQLEEKTVISLKESIIRFESDDKYLDYASFNSKVDVLYEKYSIDELKEMAFAVCINKKEI